MRQAPAKVLAVVGVASLAARRSRRSRRRSRRSGSAHRSPRPASYAALGQNQLRGYQLCVKQANEKGGALGRKLELIVEDDESTAARATAIYEKLVTQAKVDAILGPYSSSITEAVADVDREEPDADGGAAGSAPSIFRKGRRFVFMVQSPAEVTSRA